MTLLLAALPFLVALPPELASHGKGGPPVQEDLNGKMPLWYSSLGMAQLEAKRKNLPILAVVTPDPDRGQFMAESLSAPFFERQVSRFVLVKLDQIIQINRLFPGTGDRLPAQIVFISPHGKILKRLSGMARPTDLKFLLNQVASLKSIPSPKILPTDPPNRKAHNALILAMRGEVETAGRTLALLPRNLPATTRATVAEAYGAIGDEWRARGELTKAISPFQTATGLSQGTAQNIRWRFRLVMTQARVARTGRVVSELISLASNPNVPAEDRPMVSQWAYRIAGSYASSMVHPGVGVGPFPATSHFPAHRGVR